MEINRNLAKQKFYELSSELEYTVDLSLYKDVSNCYVLFLKEDENEVSLIPSQNYVINKGLSKIVFASILEGYKYFGILENVELPTFDWTSLESLSDLNAEQLNSLNENFEMFVKDVYKTLTEYSPLILTNNINKEKYVYPKLMIGQFAIMGEEGLEPYDFEEVKTVFDTFNDNIDALEKWREYSEEVMSIMEDYELGNPSQLLTDDKSSFVGAVNEIYSRQTEIIDNTLEKGNYVGTAEDLKNDIDNLEDNKLEKGNYTGTAEDLKNDIDTIDNYMVGTIFFNTSNVIHTGYLKCNGATVSRTTYARLFAKIGTTFGAGDGSTTFNLPDLRGEFIRGWDDGRGIDIGRVLGSSQGDAFQGHFHQIVANQSNSTGQYLGDITQGSLTNASSDVSVRGAITDGTNGTPRTAAETRPKNIALMAIIKF